MSHTTRMTVRISDLNTLEQACKALGYPVTVGENLTVRGYSGKRNKIKNGAVIQFGRYDLGLEMKQDGTCESIGDHWGIEGFTHEGFNVTMNKIYQQVSVAGIRNMAAEQGYDIEMQQDAEGNIVMEASRW